MLDLPFCGDFFLLYVWRWILWVCYDREFYGRAVIFYFLGREVTFFSIVWAEFYFLLDLIVQLCEICIIVELLIFLYKMIKITIQFI
jgi:hypothetical protein